MLTDTLTDLHNPVYMVNVFLIFVLFNRNKMQIESALFFKES